MEHLDTIDKFIGNDSPAKELGRLDSGLSDDDIKKIEGEDKSEETTDSTPMIGVDNDPIHGDIIEEVAESKRHIKLFVEFSK